MDSVTGHLILNEMKVELGVHEGDLPVMRFGVVQLPGNPPAGDPNSKHRFLLRGIDYNEVSGFICDCGEAFLAQSEAYDHFFNNFCAVEPDLFDNQDASECVKASGMDTAKESTNQLAGQDMNPGCSSNQFDQESDTHMELMDMNIDMELASGSKGSDLKQRRKKKPRCSEMKKSRCTASKIINLRETIEAIFIQYGYPKDYKHEILYAAVLGMQVETFQGYICQSRKMEPEDNPYRKNLSSHVMEMAKKAHEEVIRYITNRELPDVLKNRSEEEMIVAVIRFKQDNLSKGYRRILAKHLKVGESKIIKYYRMAKHFEDFKKGPVPSNIKKQADELHETVTSELLEQNPSASKSRLIKGTPVLRNQRLVVEAIWEKYGLEYGLPFLNACAEYLSVNKLTMKHWWWTANVNSQSLKKSFYSNHFTEAIWEKAEKLHDLVLNDLDGNPGIAKRKKRQRKENIQLVMEGLFKMQGTNLTVPYRQQCADQLGIQFVTVNDYYKMAKKRHELKTENPFEHLITQEIQEQSKELHEKVKACLENENINEKKKTNN